MNRKPKCKCCGERFTPRYNNALQKYCMDKDECIKAHVEYAKKQKEKSWRKEKKLRKQKLKTRNEWMKDLQKVFNTYIRERDKGKPCISCDRPIDETNTHASHYYSVGAYPNLRFNEDNVNASCNYCNLHLHGNIAEYAIRLPKRIGQDRFDKLVSIRNGEPLKLSIDEIKDKIKHYRDKTKSIKADR